MEPAQLGSERPKPKLGSSLIFLARPGLGPKKKLAYFTPA